MFFSVSSTAASRPAFSVPNRVRFVLLCRKCRSRAAVAEEAAVLCVDVRLGVNGDGSAEGSEEKEESEEETAEYNELSERRVSNSIFGPGATGATSVVLERISPELVVDESSKSDRVAEELQRSNGIVENDHRGDNEENVLENTAKRQDERGGSADLRLLLVAVF